MPQCQSTDFYPSKYNLGLLNSPCPFSVVHSFITWKFFHQVKKRTLGSSQRHNQIWAFPRPPMPCSEHGSVAAEGRSHAVLLDLAMKAMPCPVPCISGLTTKPHSALELGQTSLPLYTRSEHREDPVHWSWICLDELFSLCLDFFIWKIDNFKRVVHLFPMLHKNQFKIYQRHECKTWNSETGKTLKDIGMDMDFLQCTLVVWEITSGIDK